MNFLEDKAPQILFGWKFHDFWLDKKGKRNEETTEEQWKVSQRGKR